MQDEYQLYVSRDGLATDKKGVQVLFIMSTPATPLDQRSVKSELMASRRLVFILPLGHARKRKNVKTLKNQAMPKLSPLPRRKSDGVTVGPHPNRQH